MPALVLALLAALASSACALPFPDDPAGLRVLGAAARTTISTPELPVVEPAELFAALDPNHPDPAIAEIRAAAAEGNLGEASALYLAWRRALPWRHPLRDAANELADEELMARSRTIAASLLDDGVLIPFYVGWTQAAVAIDPFDWAGLAKKDPAAWGDAHRLYFLNDLGRVWRESNDARAAEAFFDAALPWIDLYRPRAPVWPPGTETPYPIVWSQYPYNSSDWRPIEAGIRLQDGLTSSVAYFLDAPEMTPAAHAKLVGSIYEHARFLMDYDTVGVNWQGIEAAGLMAAGALYPEFADAPLWRAEAARRARATIAGQYLSDGAQWELSPHYHSVAARNLWLIAELWRIAEPGAEPLLDVEASIERSIDYSLRLQRPDGTEPLLGDSVGVIPIRDGFYLDEWRNAGGFAYGRARFDRPDWDFFAGAPEAEAPPLDFYPDDSRYLVVRSDWSPQALYVGMDLGPLGRTHQHEDALHVSLESGGERWLADTGRGYYSDAFGRASYYTNSAGHNTARPLGRSQTRQVQIPFADWPFEAATPESLVEIGRERWAYARGKYDKGYGLLPTTLPDPGDGLPATLLDPTHERMLFVDRETGTTWVFDEMASENPVAWEVFWHYDAASAFPVPGPPSSPRFVSVDKPNQSSLRTWHDSSTGTLASLQVVSGRIEPTPQGWIHDAWAAPRPIPTVVATMAASTRTSLLSAFTTAPAMASSLVRAGVGADGRAVAYRLYELNARDATVALFNPAKTATSIVGIETDAECVALWTTEAPTRRVWRWAMVNGTSLVVDGTLYHQSAGRETTEGATGSAIIAR